MIAFVRCVAETVVEKGVRGLAEMVPGGPFAYDVAGAAWRKYRDRRKADEIRAEVQQLAQIGFEDAKREAVAAAREAAGGDPPIELELYLQQIPAAVKQSLKRADDPSGLTVPAEFSLQSADDMLKLLPPRPPRFRPDDPLPGQPGWHLVELLGVGGFGEVWLARHPRMASLCGAVKFCHGPQARDLQHEGGLIDRILATGPHPNIVRLTNAHLDGDTPWLMYEYVPGGDLADWIRQLQRHPADERVRRAVAALRHLAGAVGHFHRMTPAIVHRDLKPSNILVDKANQRLRITDFGIGAITAGATLHAEACGTATQGGRLLSYLRGSHTPLYASPQQRSGAAPDPRDDVHALGIIGYQLITGHLAQGAGPDFADDLKDAGAPAELIALLGRCVAQKAERRPATAAELNEALAVLEVAETPLPTEVRTPARQPAAEAVRAITLPKPDTAVVETVFGCGYLFVIAGIVISTIVMATVSLKAGTLLTAFCFVAGVMLYLRTPPRR